MAGLVTVRVFYDVSEARVARSLLDQHGVTVFLFDQYFADAAWHFQFALAGLRLQVPQSELELARNVLATRSEDPGHGAVDHCPRCHSGNVFRQSSWIIGLLGLLWAVPTPVRTRRRRCRNCGLRWKQDAAEVAS